MNEMVLEAFIAEPESIQDEMRLHCLAVSYLAELKQCPRLYIVNSSTAEIKSTMFQYFSQEKRAAVLFHGYISNCIISIDQAPLLYNLSRLCNLAVELAMVYSASY